MASKSKIPTAHKMSEDELQEFLADCYSLKPAWLKISEINWKYALRCILKGENLLVRGEAGFGKTVMLREAARVLDRKFYKFNFGATQDARSSLIGNTHFNREKGTFVSRAYFIRAITTPYAFVLLDELSRGHPDALNIIMSVLDQEQRYLRIDEEADEDAVGSTIPVAEGVCFGATANVGSEYTGTRTMDRALTDRFDIIMMDPPSVADEEDLLAYFAPRLNKESIHAVVDIADISRKEVLGGQGKIDTMISTRKTRKMAELMQDGFTLEEAAAVHIYPFYDAIGGADSPRTFMVQAVQKHVKYLDTINKKAPYKKKKTDKPWDD